MIMTIRMLLIFFLFVIMNPCFAGVQIVGHRGARGRYPENTLIGFQKALQLGATMLELDVVMSRDKKLVVSHDGYLSHQFCLQPNGQAITKQQQSQLIILNMDYSQIQKFDCGKNGNPQFPQQLGVSAAKPLLTDVFVEMSRYEKIHQLQPTPIVVEIKSKKSFDNILYAPPKQISDAVYKTIRQYRSPKEVVVLSFDERILKYWHQHYPDYPLAIAFDNTDVLHGLTKRLGFVPKYFAPKAVITTTKMMTRLHKLPVKIYVWGAKDANDLMRLAHLPLDGIVTDYPSILKEIFRDLSK